MKIAQLIGRFNWGGAARAALNLAIGLEELGQESLCIAIRDDDHYTTAGRFPVRMRSLFADGGPISWCRGVLRLRQVLQQERVEILHIHAKRSVGFGFAALLSLPRRRRPRVFISWHDSLSVLEAGDMADRFLTWALGRSDGVLCCSSNILQRLSANIRRELPVPPTVLHNGVPDLGASQGLDREPPIVLWASRFVPAKDPLILLRSCAQLRRRGLELRVVMAGDAHPHLGWYAEQVRELAGAVELAGRVELPGWLPDLSAYYHDAAIGVQTSHAEGMSMALLEQMMAGMAIVATEVGGTAEAVEHEKSGLLIPPCDQKGLTDALERLVSDRRLRMQLGQTARAEALRRFSCGAMAATALHQYTCALGKEQ